MCLRAHPALSIVAIFMAGFPRLSVAIEPPATTPVDAVRMAEVAFIGRVTEIQELDHTRGFSRAVASITVERSLRGTPASADGTVVDVEYYSKYRLFDPGLPAEFAISDLVLVVFGQTPTIKNGRLQFRSTVHDGFDLAYTFIDGLSPETTPDPLSFVSVYGFPRGSTSLAKLLEATKGNQ